MAAAFLSPEAFFANVHHELRGCKGGGKIHSLCTRSSKSVAWYIYYIKQLKGALRPIESLHYILAFENFTAYPWCMFPMGGVLYCCWKPKKRKERKENLPLHGV